jgi:hypothetical protein
MIILDWKEVIPTFSSSIGRTGISMEFPSVMMSGIEAMLTMHHTLTLSAFFSITTPRLILVSIIKGMVSLHVLFMRWMDKHYYLKVEERLMKVSR